MVKYERVTALLKCLMAAYTITGILLVITAALLYKFGLTEKVVEIIIIAVYVISSLLSGLLYSKGAKSRRFLWGMAAGAAYFLIICLIYAYTNSAALRGAVHNLLKLTKQKEGKKHE